MKFHAVRVSEETYNKIRDVLAKVSSRGWSGFGSKREGNICLGSVVDEAISQFQAKQRR
jgi:hypothetical protein